MTSAPESRAAFTQVISPASACSEWSSQLRIQLKLELAVGDSLRAFW